MPDDVSFIPLIIALGIGLLIGLERGWQDRSDPDGSRVAGIRTFGLIGFLGGLVSLIDPTNGFVIAAGLVALAVLLREGLEAQIDVTKEVSVTTMIAALLTYALGVLAVRGSTQLAAASGVLTALLLWLRPSLHALLHRISETELSAFLRLLLISVVVLPVLPDQTFDPYNTLNPRTIWWMVVIISGLGFFGYLGLKWLGTQRGVGLLAITGGMVSSTAVTFSFAKLARDQSADTSSLIIGTLIAWAIMIIRTLFVVGLLAPKLLEWMMPVFGPMLLATTLLAGGFFLRPRSDAALKLSLPNPIDLKSALFFAGLLTGAMFLSAVASEAFGTAGLYATSIIAGAVDIDAISLSLAREEAPDLGAPALSMAICLAAFANTFIKASLAATIGKGTYGRYTFLASLGLIAVGAISLGLTFQ